MLGKPCLINTLRQVGRAACVVLCTRLMWTVQPERGTCRRQELCTCRRPIVSLRAAGVFVARHKWWMERRAALLQVLQFCASAGGAVQGRCGKALGSTPGVSGASTLGVAQELVTRQRTLVAARVTQGRILSARVEYTYSRLKRIWRARPRNDDTLQQAASP